MPVYDYKARTESGELITGTRQAETELDLAQSLQSESVLVIDIQLKNDKKAQIKQALQWKTIFAPKISKIELQIFCQQMYSLIKAGIPLASAVSWVSETTKEKKFAEVLNQIVLDLNSGHDFATSLKQYPNFFSDFFISLIKVGEETGQLEPAFNHLNAYLLLEVETKKKIKTVLRYPTMVLIACIVAIIVINVMVIPAFSKMLLNSGRALPLPTRILIASSNFFVNYWPLLLIGSLFGLIGFRWYIAKPQGKLWWSRILIRLPILGSILYRLIIARFARLYALSLKSGISAIDGLRLVAKATGNAYVASRLTEMGNLITRGNSISAAIKQIQLFSPLVMQMVSLGEESGQIDSLLDEVADFYEREVDYEIKRLADVLEPIILLVMAAMVLVLALGVFLPMWDMVSRVRG